MGPWRRSKWWGACLVLVVGLARVGWAAEPYPPPPPELPGETSEPPLAGDWPAALSDEERAVVEHLEFLEMMEFLEHLEVLRNWEVVANPPPSEYEPQSPPGEERSYGDLEPR